MSKELSYMQLKSANDARYSEEQRTEQRRRNLLLLILHFFQEEGYLDSMNCLEREAGVSLKKFEICDNIDLVTILQEYESYFYVKFTKWPKISKRVKNENKSSSNRASSNTASPSKMKPNLKSKSNSFSLPNINNNSSHTNSDSEIFNTTHTSKRPVSDTKFKRKSKDNSQKDSSASPSSQSKVDISLSGTALNSTPQEEKKQGKKAIVDYRAILTNTLKEGYNAVVDPSERLLKPVAGFAGLSGEYRDLATVVSRDIYLENPNVYWSDIIGLDEAKRLVKEAVVYPIKYPQLFTGILSPWKGLLLYGPPGTGKTLLAKAVATECNTTFFNISASTIVSKWRGDSEKLVRVLFELARFHAPSTIFLDELDSLMSQRGSSSAGGEHEGSRRMKTELLVQMDGLSKSDDLVFLLAASNIPWELDHAMLRRLEKRILVDLPTKDARKRMIEHHLPPVVSGCENGLKITTDIDYERLAGLTEDYSGSDIRLVCKEAAMRPVRSIFNVLEEHQNNDNGTTLPELKVEPVETSDVEAALQRTKPSARKIKGKYEKWQEDFGSV